MSFALNVQQSYNKPQQHAFVPGLPGKSVKRAPFQQIDASNQSSNSQPFLPGSLTPYQPTSHRGHGQTSKRSPLGITVNTDIVSNASSAPLQVFPPTTKSSQPDSTQSNTPSAAQVIEIDLKRKLKRCPPPPPLNLARELSPSDRDIPIILSVPLGQPSINESSLRRYASSKYGQLSGPNTARTPAIIITPTHEKSEMLILPSTTFSPPRARPASSVYSKRPTVTSSNSTPAVPPLPIPSQQSQNASHSRPTLARIDTEKSRVVSTYTTFEEEEDSPIPDEETPLTGGVQPKSAKRTSFETALPTPRRSKGWWNLLTSPFLARMNSIASTHGGTVSANSDRVPELPSGQRNVNPIAEARETETDVPRSLSSPFVTPKKSGTGTQNVIYTHGEAAKYFDSNTSFDTPQLQRQDTSELSNAETVHSMRGSQSPDSMDSVMEMPETPEHVIERSVWSPLSPSPIVGVASVGVIHSARSVESERPRTMEERVQPPAETWPLPPPSEITRSPVEVSQQPPVAEKAISNEELPMKVEKEIPPTFDPPPREVLKEPKKRKPINKSLLFLGSIGCFLFLLILMIVLLIIYTSRTVPDMPTQSAWLNLTGFPPLPTGISTIAQPEVSMRQHGCVEPEDMWSCAVPQDQESSALLGTSAQPNFRLEIRYNKHTIKNSSLIQHNLTRRAYDSGSYAAHASRISRSASLYSRDTLSDLLFASNPKPPSKHEQNFLANTTDGIRGNFDGEKTPFFISFLPTTVVKNATISRRSAETNDSATSNKLSHIPKADTLSNGTAATTHLYPFPESQPLKLYDRGLDTEHYGFYTYFDRSLYVQLPSEDVPVTISSSTSTTSEDNATALLDANAVCTWSQTRFLVQIWTSPQFGHQLLPTSSTVPNSSNMSVSNSTLSANIFTRPGSFPWPVTVTLDRHGGDAADKAVYCYALDKKGVVDLNAKVVWSEDRSFNGTIVNPASGSFTKTKDGKFGGVDGGNGGCKCRWDNWQ